MYHNKSNVGRRHERTDEPLIKLIHDFQMHVRRFPRVLVHEIERRVGDELIQMRVILLLKQGKSTSQWIWIGA